MVHFFDVDVAKEYGINAAVILCNLAFWIKKNEANEKHFHNGTYWTYNSRKAFQSLFPYLGKKQIECALLKLADNGIIVTGNYNEKSFDKTLWYALTDKGKSIVHFWEIDDTILGNGTPHFGKPIPDNKPDNKLKKEIYKEKSFSPPSVDEVKAYCRERNNNISAETFVDFYSSKGWVVGKSPMKDWKACVRTWERNHPNNKAFDDEQFERTFGSGFTVINNDE